MNSPIASNLQPVPGYDSRDMRVRLENISVCYRLHKEPILTFKEYALRRLRGRIQHVPFWALKEVSLALARGEALGIVGRNGAGKSTLLKIAARVMRPTAGRVWLKGRLAPFLELGSGFQPELTGRENIYLNGTLLGFSRREMRQKFERIVGFAELGEFIDAPLRTYSSGMVARLGFSIVSDMRPDVLVLDEILAVGDEKFQRKSIDRMQRFLHDGAAILFVSHDMAAIRRLCKTAIWLEQGTVAARGEALEVISQYQGSLL